MWNCSLVTWKKVEFPSLSQHPLPRIQSLRMIWLFGAQRNFSLNTAPPPSDTIRGRFGFDPPKEGYQFGNLEYSRIPGNPLPFRNRIQVWSAAAKWKFAPPLNWNVSKPECRTKAHHRCTLITDVEHIDIKTIHNRCPLHLESSLQFWKVLFWVFTLTDF